MAFDVDIHNLEDQSLNKEFAPPESKPLDRGLTFDYKKMIEDRQEEKFMEVIKTGDTFEKLATIVEKYGETNHLPDMLIQASKIRKNELSGAITREFGIRAQYEILVSEMLGKPEDKI